MGATREAGRAFVVGGEAGVGKSAVLAEAAACASRAGFRRLDCTGIQNVTTPGLTALRELLHPILDRIDVLPARQRSALLTAVGLVNEPPPDRLLVCLATLGLLETVAKETPLLVVAENVQWLDSWTAEVIGFIGRRLTTLPILLLASCRSGVRHPLKPFGLPGLDLRALGGAESEQLLDSLPGRLSSSSRSRVLHDSGGNPLALLELAAGLHESGLADAVHVPLPLQLPLTRRLDGVFQSVVGALPASSQRLLLLAAAGDDLTLTELGEAGRRVDLDLEALGPLEDAGLLTARANRLLFRHPLVRSAAYGIATTSERIIAHETLAAVLGDAGRATWHRAAVITGRDERVARELEVIAERAVERGAMGDAATAFRRAADLSAATGDRARRLATAAEAARQAGRTVETHALLDEAMPLATEPVVLAGLLSTETSFRVSAGGTGRSSVDLLALARGVTKSQTASPNERSAAAISILLRAALVSHREVTPAHVRHDIRSELLALRDSFANPQWLTAMAVLDPGEMVSALRQPLWSAVRENISSPTALMSLGLAAEALQDLATATYCWAVSVELLRRVGSTVDLTEALLRQGRLRVLGGHLTEGLADLEEAQQLAVELGAPLIFASAAACAARVHSWRGNPAGASAAIRRSRKVSETESLSAVTAELSWAEGLGALSEHRYRAALTALSGTSVHPGTAVWAVGDLAEAAALAGETGSAREIVENAERSVAFGSSHLQMLVHRGRALLSRGDEAAEYFGRSLSIGAHASTLEVARTRLLYGEWLRRERRIGLAREQLTDALGAFTKSGARPWAARARAALRLTGVDTRAADGYDNDLSLSLTAQEMRIARLASDGLTNKEIAGEIYLSHRTVGTHLSNALHKLCITNRGQLRDALHLQENKRCIDKKVRQNEFSCSIDKRLQEALVRAGA